MRFIISQVKDFSKKVQKGLNVANWETKREIITAIIKEIVIHENDIQIIYRINSKMNIIGKNAQHCLKHRNACNVCYCVVCL